MAEEKYSLKWNDFAANVCKSFKDLRDETDFYDMTLVSEDQKQVSAHKVVLSSCSEYFKNILKQNKHSHPLLCLNNVNSEDLKNLLDYVYYGEVKIYQTDLDRFLDIAQRFKLDGLIQNEDSKILKNEDVIAKDENWTHEKDLVTEKKIQQSSWKPADNSNENSSKVAKIAVNGTYLSDPSQLSETIESLYVKAKNSMYVCNTCGKEFKNSSHIKEHVEIHIEGLQYCCNLCEKVFSTKHSLRSHRRVHS